MDVLEDTFFQQLASACSESRQAFDQHVGMSQVRRQLLTLLPEIGKINPAAIQQQLVVDGTTITRLVKQFESEGGLSRCLDPQENRNTLGSLTVSGQYIVARLSGGAPPVSDTIAHWYPQRRTRDGAARSRTFTRRHTRSPGRKPAANMSACSTYRQSIDQEESFTGDLHDSNRQQGFGFSCLRSH